MNHSPAVRLLVCGERLRRDDAAAPIAIAQLPRDVAMLAEILEVGQLALETLLAVPEGVALVVADAAVGVAPGEVVTLPLAELAAGRAGARGAAGGLAGAGGAGGGATPASSHSIPTDEVLAMAAELRGAAPRGVFVGIGGADFGFGEGLSPAVEAALPAFAAAIARAIRDLAGTSSGGEVPS